MVKQLGECLMFFGYERKAKREWLQSSVGPCKTAKQELFSSVLRTTWQNSMAVTQQREYNSLPLNYRSTPMTCDNSLFCRDRNLVLSKCKVMSLAINKG